MPHKYEREIEEILRNLEGTEPRNDPGERIRPFARPAPRRPRGPRTSFSPQVELPLTLMALGIAVALAGGALQYYQTGPSLISGVIALGGFVLFVVGVALGWWARFRGVSYPTRSLRSLRSLRRQPPTDNVVRIRPVRSNPISSLATRMRMMRMRRRYRNFTDR
jgi:hypothetical protein